MTEPVEPDAVTWPPTLDDLTGRGWVGQVSASDHDALADALAAAVAAVTRWAPDSLDSASKSLGALMLAARLWHRRNAPLGLADFGDLGPAQIRSYDPDIGRLLRLDYPRIG